MGTHSTSSLRVVSLFSGVAGLDRGLELAGHQVVVMCESWEPARRVLAHHYPSVPMSDDVREFTPDIDCDLLAAGFPCADLSHAGGKAGIFGSQSGLVKHVFRIAAATKPSWIMLENVPNLRFLHQGAGIAHVLSRLEDLGYSWAYRTVDSRFTGVPQRRPRVIILASADHDPAPALLGQDAGELASDCNAKAWGFYWTEGRRGLGLVPGAIPTLKGGSTLGLPSAPSLWLPDAEVGRKFVLPGIEDGEALQGLPRGWTERAVVAGERDLRWKLVGNAVTVGVGRWLGERITSADSGHAPPASGLIAAGRWPLAGWGRAGEAWASDASVWPMRLDITPLQEMVDVDSAKPLSHRATSGFLSRLEESGMKSNDRFRADLREHQAAMSSTPPRMRRRVLG